MKIITGILLRFMNKNHLNKSCINVNKSQHPIVSQNSSIRDAYIKHDIDEYYKKFGSSYRNPHDLVIAEIVQLAWQKWYLNWCKTGDLSFVRVMDLACGSGEVTLALEKIKIINIDGIDPFTYENYQKRTRRIAQRFTFMDISQGVLLGSNYDLIICSFALHLAPISQLPLLLYHLGLISKYLLVITPHKRPEIKPSWSWFLLEEISWKRVKARLYQSSINLG